VTILGFFPRHRGASERDKLKRRGVMFIVGIELLVVHTGRFMTRRIDEPNVI